MNTEENRSVARVPVDVRTLFKGVGMDNAHGRVRDISPSGMFVVSDQALNAGDYIFADLDVEGIGKIVWTQGRGVRVTPAGMGIAFTHVDEKGIHALLALQGLRRRPRRRAKI